MKVRLLGTGAIYSKYNCASELIDDKILVDLGNGDTETIRKKYKNKIIATHLRDDTREELKKKCLKDVIIKEDGIEIII